MSRFKLVQALNAYDMCDGEDIDDEAVELLEKIALAVQQITLVKLSRDTTTSVGLTLFEPYTVSFGGVVYNTTFNAFQAQKALPKERASFALVSTSEALALGRQCTIDPVQWDKRTRAV